MSGKRGEGWEPQSSCGVLPFGSGDHAEFASAAASPSHWGVCEGACGWMALPTRHGTTGLPYKLLHSVWMETAVVCAGLLFMNIHERGKKGKVSQWVIIAEIGAGHGSPGVEGEDP